MFVVRPLTFGRNAQTASTNALQAPGDILTPGDRNRVDREFDRAVQQLTRAGIEVIEFDPPREVATPDAVFPNNWVSTHADGTVVLYPMMAPNRRLERQPALLESLSRDFHFHISRIVDLSWLENDHEYVEGTGSMVFDHAQRIAYAALSPRTTPRAVECAAQALGQEACVFSATHASGAAVYHTNVMLSVGSSIAVGCFEMIRAAHERNHVLRRLESGGRPIVTLSEAQAGHFAANALELKSPSGPLLALSMRAWNALEPDQRRTIERHVLVLPVDVSTIEHVGGGGIRCMLAEIFLPREPARAAWQPAGLTRPG